MSHDSRTLAITQNITLDGRIEMLGDWFDPQGQADQGDLIEENHRQDAAADALLVGRQTFLDFRGYWRDLEDDVTGVSDYLNGVQKYVVSASLTEPEWDRTTVISLADVAALKQDSGRDIVCTGSITLTHALIGAGLVDEYRLFGYPVVQGAGRGLFPDGYEASGLRLLGTRAFRCGITLTTYTAATAAPGGV